MAKVRVTRGTEGPHYDPYSYAEITFTRTDGTVIVYHNGLIQSLEIDGREVHGVAYDD
jgi:hypothetical protein